MSVWGSSGSSSRRLEKAWLDKSSFVSPSVPETSRLKKLVLRAGADLSLEAIVTTVPLSVSYGGAKPLDPWVRTSNFVPFG